MYALAGRWQVIALVLIGAGAWMAGAASLGADGADAALPRLGVTRGICVVLGDQPANVSLQLARQS